MVCLFSVWSLGVAYDALPLYACCSAPSYAETILAILNFPSWLPASLAANAVYGHSFTEFVTVKQLAWIILCVPQWWTYIAICRFLRNRR